MESPATGAANSVLVAGYVSGVPPVRAIPAISPSSLQGLRLDYVRP